MAVLEDGAEGAAGDPPRSAGDAVWGACCAAPASTSCRSCSTCSRATCRWSGRAWPHGLSTTAKTCRPIPASRCVPPSRQARHHRLVGGQRLFRGETPQVEQMQRRVELDLWYISTGAGGSTCRSWRAPASRCSGRPPRISGCARRRRDAKALNVIGILIMRHALEYNRRAAQITDADGWRSGARRWPLRRSASIEPSVEGSPRRRT